MTSLHLGGQVIGYRYIIVLLTQRPLRETLLGNIPQHRTLYRMNF